MVNGVGKNEMKINGVQRLGIKIQKCQDPKSEPDIPYLIMSLKEKLN